MKYIIGTIILILLYLIDFIVYALLFVAYLVYNFNLPNCELLWGYYHTHYDNGKIMYGGGYVPSTPKETWECRKKRYNFIGNVMKKGQGS